MPIFPFMPYDFYREALKIDFDSITIDGESKNLEQYLDAETHSLNIASVKSWKEIKLGIQASDPQGLIDEPIYSDEKSEEVLSVLFIQNSDKCRNRIPIKSELDDGKWNAVVELHNNDNCGTTKLKAYAIRKKERIDNQNDDKANNTGERVLDSAEWKIYIDEKPFMPGNSMDSDWKKFSDPSNKHLNKYSDLVWYLDFTDEENPKLYLNEDIEGLKRIMENQSRLGTNACLRDTLIKSILQPVLMSLVDASLSTNVKNIDELTGWQRGVLTDIAGKGVADNITEELMIEKWMKDWSEENGVSQTLLGEVSAGIQRHLELDKETVKLIKAVEKEEKV